jgi:methyltransferase-like protein/SAM-dependent methyltransferase
MATGPNTYDEVPYDNLAFAQTHPDRMATTARMFGLQPPPIATARVLELGCASGGNLIPMAFNLPDAEFVGIDLSRTHVDAALSTMRALGMRNIRIAHGSILDIDESWGRFDYIICHGVFSWVEPQVQDAILRVAADNLVENGIAYISYNTYPGWHMREAVRHMMRYHAGRFDEPTEQIEQARALLDFLASAADSTGPYGHLLSVEIGRLAQTSDTYLYHEHLERTNSPLYFHQFVERAESAGLQYLSEADISVMLASLFPAPIAETLERISPDILHLEQYMDFVRNRQFRQTLLCHRHLRPTRALSPASLQGLLVSSAAVPGSTPVDFTQGTAVVFSKDSQRATMTLAPTKAAMIALADAWPVAVRVDELCDLALERAIPFLPGVPADADRRALMLDLFACVTHGVIHLHTQQLPCTNRPSDTPRANALAAYQATFGFGVVNAHHQMVHIDPLSSEVLKLANGERSTGDLVDALMPRVASGGITLEEDGQLVTAPEAVRPILSSRLEKTLVRLTRAAVIES